MRRGKETHWDFLLAIMDDPRALLQILDQAGVWRIGMVNYPSPDVMGFTEEVHTYASDFARACGGRVIPIGSVHPTLCREPERAVRDLVAWGFRGIKIHPSHQGCSPNAYRHGNAALETIYRKAEESGLILIVHTGTSVFPGARNVHADGFLRKPFDLDALVSRVNELVGS